MRHNVLVAGDFNAPDINWEADEATITNNSTSEKLLDIINEHDLLQLVREPTRRDDNILDLVLTNNNKLVSNITVVPGISDHDIVTFDLNTHCQKKRNVKRKVYIRKRADLHGIKKGTHRFCRVL